MEILFCLPIVSVHQIVPVTNLFSPWGKEGAKVVIVNLIISYPSGLLLGKCSYASSNYGLRVNSQSSPIGGNEVRLFRMILKGNVIPDNRLEPN